MLCDGEQQGEYEFEIKIEKSDGGIVIGIDEGRTNELCKFHLASSTHYAMSSGGLCFVTGKQNFHSYGCEHKSGDIMKFKVDVGRRTISYLKKNCGWFELATIQLSKTPHYLAVYMKWRGYKITLTKYSCTAIKQESKEPDNEVARLKAKVSSLETSKQKLKEKLKISEAQKVALQQRNIELKNAIKDRDDTVSHLQQQLLRYENDQKQKELEVQNLRDENKRLKLQHLAVSNFLQWNHSEICKWIIGLDNGRLVKYKEKLRVSLEEEEVDGQILDIVDGGDLKRWGVTKLADIKFLQKELLNLVNNAPGKDHGCGDREGANDAPTVHH